MRLAIIKAPAGYDRLVGEWPVGVSVSRQLRGSYDCIHYFATSRLVLEAVFANLVKSLTPTGMLWISWPNVTSGVTTDLDESVIRKLGLAGRTVDVKVAAVDDTWSALKFVRRAEDR